jgi:hypothetical protein
MRMFGNTGYALSLIRHGRMGLLPKKIKQIRQIQAIIKKADEFGDH